MEGNCNDMMDIEYGIFVFHWIWYVEMAENRNLDDCVNKDGSVL